MLETLIVLIVIGIPIAAIWACVRVYEHDKEIRRLRTELNEFRYAVNKKLSEGSKPESTDTKPDTDTRPDEKAAVTPAVSEPERPRPTPENPPYTPPTPRPAPAAAYSAPPARPAVSETAPAAKDKTTFENWLGRNVLGVVASILVFIGLIFLGVLVYKNITDNIKIVLMYALSALITGVGVALSAKKRNNFTVSLIGCGCGSFFISILLTHVYFGKIEDFAAFALLLVWMIATLLIAKWQRSTLLSVVAHAGMIISLCFAFAFGISDEKLLLVMIYQAACCAVILLGNIFCCKRTYHLGVFISIALTLIASFFMLGRFIPYTNTQSFDSTLPAAVIAAAFAVQFVMISFFSYLLSVSANRFESDGVKIGVHLLNKSMWALSLFVNIYVIARRLVLPYYVDVPDRMAETGIALLVCLVPLTIHVVLSIIMQKKFKFDKILECISVLMCFAMMTIFTLVFWGARPSGAMALPRLPWLIILALGLFLVRRFSRQRAYLVAADLLLALDFLFALFGGYSRLTDFGTPALALGWLLVYVAIILCQWFIRPKEQRKHGVLLRVVLYLVAVLSLFPILFSINFEYPAVTILLILTAIHFLLLVLRYDRGENAGSLSMLIRAVSGILVATNAVFIAFVGRYETTEYVLYYCLSALAFLLAFARVHELFRGNGSPLRGVLAGASLTALVLATVHGNTEWFSEFYILSLTTMFTALICIVVGFVGKVGTLRFYGLILTLVCVLKLVTFDVAELGTPLRVVALIVGGVMCFIISAIYNYTVKHLEQSKSPTNDITD